MAQLTVSNPVPTVPGIVTLNPFPDGIELIFDRPIDPDFAGIKVHVSTVNAFTPDASTLKYDGPHSKPIFIDGLLQSTTYYLKFYLYDIFGDSSVSTQYSTTTLATPDGDTIAPTVPGTPTFASIVRESKLYATGELKVSWTAATDNSGKLFYRIEFWVDAAKKTTVETQNLSYTIYPAEIGVLYNARVQAVDFTGNESAFSATATHTITGDTTAPATPKTGQSPFSAAWPQSGDVAAGLDKVTLYWTNPTDPDFLQTEVHRSTTTGFTPSTVTRLNTTRASAYVDANVVNGTTYYYKLVALDVQGNPATATAQGSGVPFTITSANISNYFASAAIGDAYIANLDAVKITAGDIATARMTANFLVAAQATISQLSSITANIGTVTAGTIKTATFITNLTDTGARVRIDSTNGIQAYDSGGVQRVSILVDGSGYMGSSAAFSWTAAGVVTIAAANVSGTLTANTYQTSSGNPRIMIDSTNGLRALNASGVVTAQLLTDGTGFLGVGTEKISWTSAGALTVNTLRTAASGKRMEIVGTDNEMHFYGDRGDATVEELATIGIKTDGSDTVIGVFGTLNSTRKAAHFLANVAKDTVYINNTHATGRGIRVESLVAGANALAAQIVLNQGGGDGRPSSTQSFAGGLRHSSDFKLWYGQGGSGWSEMAHEKSKMVAKAWVNFKGTQQTGTYAVVNNVNTITITAHGVSTGERVQLDFTTGTAPDGSFIATSTGANTFTIAQTTGNTSGNVTLQTQVRDSFNVSSVTDNGTGDLTTSFITAFANANIAMAGSGKSDSGNLNGAVPIIGLRRIGSNPTTTSARTVTHDTTPTAFDAEINQLVFFGV